MLGQCALATIMLMGCCVHPRIAASAPHNLANPNAGGQGRAGKTQPKSVELHGAALYRADPVGSGYLPDGRAAPLRSIRSCDQGAHSERSSSKP